MGWTMPWYSTAAATDPGATGFGQLRFYLRDGDTVYQTYEVDYRGTEVMDVTYGLLDRTYGRQEPGGLPRGLAEEADVGWWWRRDGRPVAQAVAHRRARARHRHPTSADGTEIAWTRQGSGPDLVMIHCVATSRERTPQPTLPDALAASTSPSGPYDCRGTGASGDGGEYAVEREIEDLAAMVGLASGPVTVYGFSSGATLALLAAAGGVRIDRLTLLNRSCCRRRPLFALRDEAQRRIDDDVDAATQWRNGPGDRQVPFEVLAELPPRTDADRRNTRTIVHELEFLPGTSARRSRGRATHAAHRLRCDRPDHVRDRRCPGQRHAGRRAGRPSGRVARGRR